MSTLGVLWRGSRATGAAYAAPLGLALEIPTLVEQRNAVGSDWTSTMEVAHGSAILLAIVAAAGAALLSTRWREAQTLVLPFGRGHWWRNVVPAGLIAVPLVTVHAAWVLGVVLYAKAQGLAGLPAPWTLAPALLAIVACALVGALIGGWTRSYLAGPLLGIGLYLALINGGAVIGPMFRLGGIGTRLLGLEVRPSVIAAQATWWGGVAISALLIGASSGARGRLRRLVLVLAGVLVLAVPTAIVASSATDRFQLAEPLSWTCVDEGPQLCALQGAEPQDLTGLRDRFAEASRRWKASSASPPVAIYWQRLELPVPGHAAEVRVASRMTDADVAFEVIFADLPCSDDWSYEQFLTAEALVEELVGAGLDEPWTPATFDLSALRCPR